MKLVTYRDGRAGVVIDDHVVALGDLDGVPGDVTAGAGGRTRHRVRRGP